GSAPRTRRTWTPSASRSASSRPTSAPTVGFFRHGGPEMAPKPPAVGASRRSRAAPRSPDARGRPAKLLLRREARPRACELLEGRERRRAPDLVDDALDERPVRLARLARGQPLGIDHEGLP